MAALFWLLAPRPEGSGLVTEEALISMRDFASDFIAGLSETTIPAPSPTADSLAQPTATKPVEKPQETTSSAEVDETKVPITQEAEHQTVSPDDTTDLSKRTVDSARRGPPLPSFNKEQGGEVETPARTAPSARGAAGELRATTRLSLLYVNTDVNGATVYLDGKTKPGWKTPCVLNLPPGGYNVTLLKAGYKAVREWVDLNPRQAQRLVVRMKSGGFPAAGIVVKTDPPRLPVFIDGQPRGFSEVYIEVSPGRHTLQIVPPSGRDPYSGTFFVQSETLMTKTIRWPTDSASGGNNSVPRRAS
jgi:hypothetical protein